MAEPIRRLGVVAQVNHLMMHVYPRVGGRWRDSISGVRRRLHLFDGLRLFGIVSGQGLERGESVADELSDIATESFVLGNDSSLREVMTWPTMICRLREAGADGRMFYCHTKGATHGPDSICHEWREVMLEACLDHPKLIDCVLSQSATCGAFRRFDGLGVPFHFSGSFYWIDLQSLWCREWGAIDQVWYGIESLPARHFAADESRCLFLDRCGDLYDSGYWASVVRPALKAWRERIAACSA